MKVATFLAKKPQKLKFNTQQKLMVGLKLHS